LRTLLFRDGVSNVGRHDVHDLALEMPFCSAGGALMAAMRDASCAARVMPASSPSSRRSPIVRPSSVLERGRHGNEIWARAAQRTELASDRLRFRRGDERAAETLRHGDGTSLALSEPPTMATSCARRARHRFAALVSAWNEVAPRGSR